MILLLGFRFSWDLIWIEYRVWNRDAPHHRSHRSGWPAYRYKTHLIIGNFDLHRWFPGRLTTALVMWSEPKSHCRLYATSFSSPDAPRKGLLVRIVRSFTFQCRICLWGLTPRDTALNPESGIKAHFWLSGSMWRISPYSCTAVHICWKGLYRPRLNRL